MKKLFILSVLLTLSWSAATAQDAEAILKRYNNAVGINDIKTATTSLRLDITVSTNSMEQMKILSIIAPPDKMRTEINAMGQKILMVTNGSEGWVSIPGMPLQAIPEADMEKLRVQGNPFSSILWDEKDYDLKLLEPTTVDGAVCDVVEMTAKKSDAPGSHQVVCFDRKSGLAVRGDIDMAGRKMEVLLKEYTKCGKIQYPARIESRVAGIETVMRINECQIGYPVTEEMFKIQ